MNEIVIVLWTTVTMLVMGFEQPTTATCPETWYLRMGVRTSGPDRGIFECAAQASSPALDRLPRSAPMPEDPVEPLRYWGRIYCNGGTRPAVIDHRTVSCRR